MSRVVFLLEEYSIPWERGKRLQLLRIQGRESPTEFHR